MRVRSSITLAALVLATTLGLLGCGGGDGDGDGSALTDTGLLFPIETGEETEPPPPPATTAEQPQEAMKIAVPAPGESIGPQSPAARVTELQQALLVLGFKIGAPDGIYGGKTVKAISRFQKQHKLEQDGLVGPKTAKAINKELREQAAANA